MDRKILDILVHFSEDKPPQIELSCEPLLSLSDIKGNQKLEKVIATIKEQQDYSFSNNDRLLVLNYKAMGPQGKKVGFEFLYDNWKDTFRLELISKNTKSKELSKLEKDNVHVACNRYGFDYHSQKVYDARGIQPKEIVNMTEQI